MTETFTNILGVKVNNINSYEEAFRVITDEIPKKRKAGYITVNNVHLIVEGILHPDYKEILNNSDLSVPDGRPLSLYAKLKGTENISRVFGPTLLENTLEWGQEKGIKHYFFGSSEETINKIKVVISKKYPKAEITGAKSPPFRKFDEDENQRFIDEINTCRPDIVWVGLGAPKQEKWIFENYNKLKYGVMIGIGAGFDYLAGNIKHAPVLMKNLSLEWFYRLIQDPKRLFKRYMVTNALFILFVLMEFLHIKKFK